MYNGMPILWYTGLQKTTSSHWVDDDPDDPDSEPAIATSSANGETIAASDTLARALHVTYVCEEVNLAVPRPIIIDMDAEAAMGFLRNTGGNGKMKHLDIRKSWIQQLRNKEVVEFRKMAGTQIPANFLTKLLDRVEYNREYLRLAHVAKHQIENKDERALK